MVGSALPSSPPPSPAPTEGKMGTANTAVPSLGAEKERLPVPPPEELVLSAQVDWVEKQVRRVEGEAEEPSLYQPAADEMTPLHRNVVKGGRQAGTKLCELWVPLDRLHRSHRGWALLKQCLVSHQPPAPPRRACRQTIHGFEMVDNASSGFLDPKGVMVRVTPDTQDELERNHAPTTIVPVHSIGVTVLSRVPRCMRPGTAESILVRVPAVELAIAGLQGELWQDLLRSVPGWRLATPRFAFVLSALLVAWTFNLSVLATGDAFLFYVTLVIFEEANASWIGGPAQYNIVSRTLVCGVRHPTVCVRGVHSYQKQPIPHTAERVLANARWLVL